MSIVTKASHTSLSMILFQTVPRPFQAALETFFGGSTLVQYEYSSSLGSSCKKSRTSRIFPSA